MPDIKKIILKMKRQPNGIRFQELAKVLEHNGYIMKPKKGTSHRQFINAKRRCYNDKGRQPIKSCIRKRCTKKNRRIKSLFFEYTLKREEGAFMKNVKEYLELPYNYIIQPVNDESGFYFYARILEFDGCQSTGETFEEAYENLREAMEGWIEAKLEGGFEVPLPVGYDDFSGKFVVRIPKSLHYKLSVEAEQEGVSLNQYALYKLSN